MEPMDSFPFWSRYKSPYSKSNEEMYLDVGNVKLYAYRYSSLCSLVPVLLRSHIYLRLPGAMHKILFGVHSYYAMLRASGKTASDTLVHQNQIFHIIIIIILLDYVYIVHLMYLH